MEHNHFKSSITYQHIWNFRPENPETYTGCEILDATMKAIYTIPSPQAKSIAKYLGLSQVKLSYALDVCAGYNLAGILELLRIKRLRKSIMANIDKSMDEIAHAAGFSDRSAIERLIKNPKFAHFFADIDLKALRPKRYYKSIVRKK